jgi:hypothetical protein
MEQDRKKAWERYIQLKYEEYYGSDRFLKDEMLADDTDARYGN